MRIENPRFRLLLGTQWRLIVLALVVVALVSFAGAGATYADRPTETVTQQTHEREVVTTTTDRATVVTDDALWPEGTELVDKPVYLVNATPTLIATATTRVTGAGDARVDHEWRLTVEVARGGDAFYSETSTLAAATHEGTTANTSAELDVPELMERVAVVREKTEGAGTVSTTLSLHVAYRIGPDDEVNYTGEETYSGSLGLEGRSYTVEDDVGGRTNHSRAATSEVPQPRDRGQIGGLALLGVLSLAFAGGVLSQDPDGIDVERARIELHRRQYEDWISPGVIPMGISQQFIELESIEDVVDVAIDTSERVVYDGRRDLYAVISENVVYYFSPGGSWMDTTFGSMDVPGDGAGGDAGQGSDGIDASVFGGGSDAGEEAGTQFSDGEAGPADPDFGFGSDAGGDDDDAAAPFGVGDVDDSDGTVDTGDGGFGFGDDAGGGDGDENILDGGDDGAD